MPDKLEEIFNISEKQVLITGATGFIGSYMAEALLGCGAKVVLLARSDKLAKQVNRYRSRYGKDSAAGFQVDFYNLKELRKVLVKIRAKYDIDVLVNNAYDLGKKTGFNTSEGRLENLTYSHWNCAFESGIYWPVLTTQVIGAHFKKKRKGSIINISSMYGIVSPNPGLYAGMKFFNPATYGVNKSGLIALTRYVASFWGKYGIRCNAVLPGPLPNIEGKSENSVNNNPAFLKRLKSNTAIKRIGHPKDLEGILIYLASDASSFMTGQAISVDGGWTIT